MRGQHGGRLGEDEDLETIRRALELGASGNVDLTANVTTATVGGDRRQRVLRVSAQVHVDRLARQRDRSDGVSRDRSRWARQGQGHDARAPWRRGIGERDQGPQDRRVLLGRRGADGGDRARIVGLLYAAPYIGALLASLVSGWTGHVRRQGLGVVAAASCWGIALVLFGFANALWLALVMLALAGAADYVSAILRSVIVLNSTPDEMRGRVTGIEFAQVASAPSLGNVEAGAVAAATSIRFSIVSGGILSVVGTVLVAAAVPALLRYDAREPDA